MLRKKKHQERDTLNISAREVSLQLPLQPQPQPQKFSTAHFTVYAGCFFFGQYLLPPLFYAGRSTAHGKTLQLLYVVLVHPILMSGLSTLFDKVGVHTPPPLSLHSVAPHPQHTLPSPSNF